MPCPHWLIAVMWYSVLDYGSDTGHMTPSSHSPERPSVFPNPYSGSPVLQLVEGWPSVWPAWVWGENRRVHCR